MSSPPIIREQYRDQPEYNRSNRDVVNGLIKRLAQSGPTASRPAAPSVGWMFYDTTLSKPIFWSGSAWKDAAGTAV